MDATLQGRIVKTNQIRRGGLELVQVITEEREIRTAFVQMAGLLPMRPEPRTRWDDQARAEPRGHAPGWYEVCDARAVLEAAKATGNPATIEGTRTRVEAYFDDLKARALAVCPAETPLPAAHAHVALVREAAEAITASTVAQQEPGRMHVAVQEAREAMAALRRFIASATHHTPARAAR